MGFLLLLGPDVRQGPESRNQEGLSEGVPWRAVCPPQPAGPAAGVKGPWGPALWVLAVSVAALLALGL